MSVVYYVPAWEKTFEISQSKRVKGDLKWVPMPTDHQSREYKRILRSEHGPSVFGAWCAIVELGARMPERGVFMDGDGPLDAEDIADETSFPVDVIEHALEILTSPKIKWLGIKNTEMLRADSEQTPSINKKSQPKGKDITVKDITGDEEEESTSPPPSITAVEKYPVIAEILEHLSDINPGWTGSEQKKAALIGIMKGYEAEVLKQGFEEIQSRLVMEFADGKFPVKLFEGYLKKLATVEIEPEKEDWTL